MPRHLTRGVEHRKAFEVTSNDWLLDQPRAAAATERILQAAASLIGRRGFDAFSIDELAAAVHCSPATIYRHAGGKAAIREAVIARLSSRIVTAVDDAILDLTGHERIVVAISAGLHHLRAEHVIQQLLRSSDPKTRRWIETSPIVTGIATSLIGSDRRDEAAAQWFVRAVLALWHWPASDPGTEREIVERFLGPVLSAQKACN
ncbi:helix-turn-helix domain-containing protein [Mycobacterium sp. NPDC006124]|uniref:TetR/AcrR family transcriptional regulator n=1 Tax=Mycobacterium sp. NPDC006124 TaxID=3156729 RepID=UPI0033A17DB8